MSGAAWLDSDSIIPSAHIDPSLEAWCDQNRVNLDFKISVPVISLCLYAQLIKQDHVSVGAVIGGHADANPARNSPSQSDLFMSIYTPLVKLHAAGLHCSLVRRSYSSGTQILLSRLNVWDCRAVEPPTCLSSRTVLAAKHEVGKGLRCSVKYCFHIFISLTILSTTDDTSGCVYLLNI